MPATVDLKSSAEFDQDPETVFDYVADPSNDPAWCPAVLACEHVSGEGVGSVWRWTQAVDAENSVDVEVTLTEVDRPHRLVWDADNDFFAYHAEMVFEPRDGGGTTVTQHNTATFKAVPDEMADAVRQQAEATGAAQFENLRRELSA